MEPVTINGIIESKARNGKSIKVMGEWYSVYSPDQMGESEWKDTVRFQFIQKDRFKNIKGTVEVTAKGDYSGSTASGGTSKGYSNVGVSMGHAWNSAQRQILSKHEHNAIKDDSYELPSDEEILKEITDLSVQIYKIMEKLRAFAEKNFNTVSEPEASKEPEQPF